MQRGQVLSLSPFEQEKGRSLRSDFKNVDRILVRGVNWVGDTILTYPTLEALKRHFPKSQITILVPSHLVDLWETSPYVDKILSFKKKRGVRSVLEDFKISRLLREKRFDMGLILPRSFRSAFQIFLAGIAIRIGYRDEGRSFLLTHGIPRTEEVLGSHRVIYYQELLKFFGIKAESLSPRLLLREEDRKGAEKILQRKGLLDGRPLIGINPGAAYGLAKCWYPDRFAEVGKRLSQKWKATSLIFGRAEERETADKIIHHLGQGGVDLTGRTSLLQLAALLERCSLLVTNDTGTMHVASAVGTPVVAIFGPTDSIATGPWGDGHIVVKKEIACSPCFKRVCPTDHRCMEGITVDEVEEIVDKKLKDLLNDQTPITKHQINANNQ
jgi:heptosyltransferase-2